MTPSRGADIRNYTSIFDTGAVIPITLLSAGFTTGVSNGGITSAKIGAAAVTSAKIGTGAVTNAKMKAAFLSGTLVSGQITKSVAHGLGVKPKFIVVAGLPTLTQAISGSGLDVYLAAASAATSSVFYIIGSQKSNVALKYVAYVQI